MAATDTASRICGNSAILFVRTALVAICGAAAVRIAVGALGADGYGTYAAVSALVGTLVLFNGVMEQTARRFLGFAVAWLLLASGFPAWTSMAAVAATNGLALVYRALHVWFILSRNSSGESTAT